MTHDEAHKLLQKRAGILMAIVLFTRAPHEHNMVQCAMGVQMWRQGASDKMFTILNHYDVCQSKQSAHGHVDRLGQHNDEVLWQS